MTEVSEAWESLTGAGVSSPRPAAHKRLRMAMNAAQHKTVNLHKTLWDFLFSLVFVYLMCGPRQLFFQYGPETSKGWTPLPRTIDTWVEEFEDHLIWWTILHVTITWGTFVTTRLSPTAEQLTESLGWDLGINWFPLLPGDSSVQPGLRVTDLV